MDLLTSSWFAYLPYLVVPLVFVGYAIATSGSKGRRLESYARLYDLEVEKPEPGLMNALRYTPAIVGAMEGLPVRVQVETVRDRNNRHDEHRFSLRMRVSPYLSREFAATREGTWNRLTARFLSQEEPQLGAEELDRLLNIRAVPPQDAAVLQQPAVTFALLQLTRGADFEFREGVLRVHAVSHARELDELEDFLKSTRRMARALRQADGSVATHGSVWNV